MILMVRPHLEKVNVKITVLSASDVNSEVP